MEDPTSPMDVLNGVAEFITGTIAYLRSNAWSILAICALGLVLKDKIIRPAVDSVRFKDPQARNISHKEEMLRVRLAQQEAASKRALVAAKERKEKERKNKDRKNHVAKDKPKGGNRLGRATENSYSPLQPGSGATGNFRTTNRHAGRRRG
uniref:Selenoprotein S n=1 Tax=Grammatophora oceanica TaxID=210454 RepID=A0A7S1ULQ4_9STRA|mmetsp:Transcript_11660/g.17113  ORF Transcript_11660/g.17113 Transcript_11660/m.17113 type:complete len:151 (+) Transcript_11660:64-516(+)